MTPDQQKIAQIFDHIFLLHSRLSSYGPHSLEHPEGQMLPFSFIENGTDVV